MKGNFLILSSSADIGNEKINKHTSLLVTQATSSTANPPLSIVQERLALEDIDVPGSRTVQLHKTCMNELVCARTRFACKCARSLSATQEEQRGSFVRSRFTSLTNHEAHELVRQDAGADERHPQADVKLPGALGLHPHEQAENNEKETGMKNEPRKKNKSTFLDELIAVFVSHTS